MIQASQLNKDEALEALQIAGVQTRSAFQAEVSFQSFAGIGDVGIRLGRAADRGEIVLGHAEPRRRLAPRCLLAVQAVTDGDEGGIGVERELDRAARALSRMFLGHMITFPLTGVIPGTQCWDGCVYDWTPPLRHMIRKPIVIPRRETDRQSAAPLVGPRL